MNIASVFSVIVAVAWIVVIGVVALAVVRASRGRPLRAAGTVVIVAAVVAIVFTALSAGLVFIQPQERGVVISAASSTGYRAQAMEPGLHWVIPFVENVISYPISRQTYTMSITGTEGQVQGDDSVAARTSDGQEIFVDASVIYAIDPDKVVAVHITWQDRYTDDLVRAQSRGIIRDAVSQYRVDEVISTNRFDMVQSVTQILAQKLSDNGLILVDFVLRNITFSPEYAASVEQKQIAEQQSQQARFVVESKRQEAEQARQIAQGQADAAVIAARGQAEARIVEAQAEAEALSLINGALQGNPDLLTYQYITKLAPSIQTLLLPADSPFIFPLPQAGPSAVDTTSTSPAVEPTTVPSP